MKRRKLIRFTRRPLSRLGVVGVVTVLAGAGPQPHAITAVYTCHCSGASYTGSATNPVPIFTGGNKLRIRGANVLGALSVEINGLAPAAINARRSGELDISVSVLPGTAIGQRTARIKYIASEETFRVTVIPRGTVTKIEEIPSQVTVNQPAWIKFTGSEIHSAVLFPTTLATEIATGATSAATFYRTQIVFKSCGTWPINAFNLHHESAPANEIANRNALYVGSATRNVTVAGCAATTTTCVSEPTIGGPGIKSPTEGQTYNYQAGVASASITIKWTLRDGRNIAAPNKEFVVTRQSNNGARIYDTVRDTSATYTFPVAGTHNVRVKAKNCGEPAPESSVTFSTRNQ